MEILGHPHHVCLACRRSKKGPRNSTVPLTCAECGAKMHYLGKLFAAPRRKDDVGWRKIELMIANGWDGTNWPVTPQMSLLEVKRAVREWQERYSTSQRVDQIQTGIERRQKLARVRSRKRRTTLKQQRLEQERQRTYQDQVLERVARANQSTVSSEN